MNMPPRHTAAVLALSVLVAVTVHSSAAFGARATLTYERVRKDNNPVILAELTDFKEVSRPAPWDASRTETGYSLTLKVHEVLRGELKAETVRIPFSPRGYSRTWEGHQPPAKGQKLLVFLAGGKGEQWDDYGMPDSIRSTDAFDSPLVRTVRAIFNLWSIMPEEAQEKALRAGCMGGDLGFRQYCVGVLRDRAYSNLQEAPEVMSFLWGIYTDPNVDLETWLACENTFRNKFRSLGWQEYEPRYAIMRSVLDYQLRTKNPADHQTAQNANYALLQLAAYANHRKEVLELLSSIASAHSDELRSSASLYISNLYDFFDTSDESRKLNAQVLAKLAELGGKGDAFIAPGAAAGVHEMVRRSFSSGVNCPELARLVNDLSGKQLGGQTEGFIRAAKRDMEIGLPKVKPLPGEANAPLAQSEWTAMLGKRVRMVGKVSWERTEGYGASLEVNHRLVWLADMKKWPFDLPPANWVLVSGELELKEDIPVFRHEKGKPFGEGLPVPLPFDLKEMGRRFVLRDAKWELIGAATRYIE